MDTGFEFTVANDMRRDSNIRIILSFNKTSKNANNAFIQEKVW